MGWFIFGWLIGSGFGIELGPYRERPAHSFKPIPGPPLGERGPGVDQCGVLVAAPIQYETVRGYETALALLKEE